MTSLIKAIILCTSLHSSLTLSAALSQCVCFPDFVNEMLNDSNQHILIHNGNTEYINCNIKSIRRERAIEREGERVIRIEYMQ